MVQKKKREKITLLLFYRFFILLELMDLEILSRIIKYFLVFFILLAFFEAESSSQDFFLLRTSRTFEITQRTAFTSEL